jgi:hypothetical protein
MKLMLSLPHYHPIYLISKLFPINLMLLWLEDCSISIGPSINPLLLLHEFQTSSLLTKYKKKANVVLNTTNSGVYFYPHPSRDFSPFITQQSF